MVRRGMVRLLVLGDMRSHSEEEGRAVNPQSFFVVSGRGCFWCSVEDIGEVVLVEELHVLLASGTEAVKKIVSVSFGELFGVAEAGDVAINVVVLLDSLNNVALALDLEELLGHHHVGVVDSHQEVTEIALVTVEAGGVAEGTLVVRNGPLRSRHHAQVVVAVGVQRRNHSVLREVRFLHCKGEERAKRELVLIGRVSCRAYLG